MVWCGVVWCGVVWCFFRRGAPASICARSRAYGRERGGQEGPRSAIQSRRGGLQGPPCPRPRRPLLCWQPQQAFSLPRCTGANATQRGIRDSASRGAHEWCRPHHVQQGSTVQRGCSAQDYQVGQVTTAALSCTYTERSTVALALRTCVPIQSLRNRVVRMLCPCTNKIAEPFPWSATRMRTHPVAPQPGCAHARRRRQRRTPGLHPQA